jgi:hypothetical protein
VQDAGVLEAHAVLEGRRKLCFTRLLEHWPASDKWIEEHTDTEPDPEC